MIRTINLLMGIQNFQLEICRLVGFWVKHRLNVKNVIQLISTIEQCGKKENMLNFQTKNTTK